MLNTIADVIKNSKTVMSLWKHECYRVIADRFTIQEDKDWFERTIKQVHHSAVVSLYCSAVAVVVFVPHCEQHRVIIYLACITTKHHPLCKCFVQQSCSTVHHYSVTVSNLFCCLFMCLLVFDAF